MQVRFSEGIVFLDKIFVIKMVCLLECFCLNLAFFTHRLVLVIAAQSIANIVKSSLGPLGLDKMLVDNIGVIYFLSCTRVRLIPNFHA